MCQTCKHKRFRSRSNNLNKWILWWQGPILLSNWIARLTTHTLKITQSNNHFINHKCSTTSNFTQLTAQLTSNLPLALSIHSNNHKSWLLTPFKVHSKSEYHRLTKNLHTSLCYQLLQAQIMVAEEHQIILARQKFSRPKNNCDFHFIF